MLTLNSLLFSVGFGLSLWAAVSAQSQASIRLWMLFVVPGTLAHELAHYGLAILTGGRPAPISLWPQKVEGRWIMGSVSFHPSLINGAFVALAPLYVLPPLAWLSFLQHDEASLLGAAGWGYLSAVLLYSAWPSGTDWALSIKYPVAYILLLPLGSKILTVLGIAH